MVSKPQKVDSLICDYKLIVNVYFLCISLNPDPNAIRLSCPLYNFLVAEWGEDIFFSMT